MNIQLRGPGEQLDEYLESGKSLPAFCNLGSNGWTLRAYDGETYASVVTQNLTHLEYRRYRYWEQRLLRNQ